MAWALGMRASDGGSLLEHTELVLLPSLPVLCLYYATPTKAHEARGTLEITLPYSG